MLLALTGLRPTENPLSQGEGRSKNGCFLCAKKMNPTFLMKMVCGYLVKKTYKQKKKPIRSVITK